MIRQIDCETIGDRFRKFINDAQRITKLLENSLYLIHSGDVRVGYLGTQIVAATIVDMDKKVREGYLPEHYHHLISGLTEGLFNIINKRGGKRI